VAIIIGIPCLAETIAPCQRVDTSAFMIRYGITLKSNATSDTEVVQGTVLACALILAMAMAIMVSAWAQRLHKTRWDARKRSIGRIRREQLSVRTKIRTTISIEEVGCHVVPPRPRSVGLLFCFRHNIQLNTLFRCSVPSGFVQSLCSGGNHNSHRHC